MCCFSLPVKLLMSDESCAMKVYKETFKKMNLVFGNLPKWLLTSYILFSNAPPTGSDMKRMIYIHQDSIMRTSNHSSSSSPFPARRTSCVSSGLCSKKQLWSTDWAGSCTSTRPCRWYGPLEKGTKVQDNRRRQRTRRHASFSGPLMYLIYIPASFISPLWYLSAITEKVCLLEHEQNSGTRRHGKMHSEPLLSAS